ncbi:viral D5 protein-like [Mangrovibacter plantisponsor]|uniref:Viral D5 protein-like n=1 Tax=Mangrovibacter plantisponsor TaxID=451513 RepID=A0A317PXK2_9ENTR|nr:viral D5 protein-like [Mangrovibacter plantisponsor]
MRILFYRNAYNATRWPGANGMYMENANIIPRQQRLYLYHAFLVYMEAHGYKNTLSLTMFGKGLSSMLKEYGLNYDKRLTKSGHADQEIVRPPLSGLISVLLTSSVAPLFGVSEDDLKNRFKSGYW